MERIARAGALSLILAGGSAGATDLAPPAAGPLFDPQPLWSGFHVGVNAGGVFSKATSDFRFNQGPVFGVAPNTISGPGGGLGGGYGWQTGALVIGFAADFQVAGGDARQSSICPSGMCSATYAQDLAWFGTVRGRLGYASGSWLAYVTGGYAYARVETRATAVAPVGVASTGWNDLASGWALGGGLEVMFAPGWSATLEGLHMRFSETSKSWMLAPALAITETGHLKANLVRAGINYRF